MSVITDSPKLVGLELTQAKPITAHQVDLSFTYAKSTHICPSPHSFTKAVGVGLGYLAGTGNGLLTVGGKTAIREILLADANNIYQGFTHRTYSLPSGQYLIGDLDPDKRYLVLARDYMGEYEPCVYDNVAPAVDLTPEQLQELWGQMTA